jgi:hypothetical protein
VLRSREVVISVVLLVSGRGGRYARTCVQAAPNQGTNVARHPLLECRRKMVSLVTTAAS